MAGKKKRGAGQRETPTGPASETAAGKPSGADWLYTRCPRCKTTYRITVAQLRSGRGEAECQQCQARFDALGALAENPARTAQEAAAAGSPTLLGRLDAVFGEADGRAVFPVMAPCGLAAADEKAASPVSRLRRIAWGGGAFLLFASLVFQLGWFEGPRLVQDEGVRPWLEAVCQPLGCRLPGFHALRRIQIIGHALTPAPDGIDGYEFSVVLANQASLPQGFPTIKLILSADNGSPVAARVFQPTDYLKGQASALMPVGEPREIRLLLAKPQREVGGFSFELL